MKTNRFIIAALSIAAAAVSCQKEDFGGVENTRQTESATIVTGEQTRTSLSGKEIHWTDDDVIAVFDNADEKNVFNISKAQGFYASFEGSVTSGTTQIYAVYPADLAVSASGSDLKVTIPTNQTSKVGSFAEEHNISVAKGTKTPGVEAIQDVTFKNVCSYLKFTVPSYVSDVKSVTLTISNRTIAGEAMVDYSGTDPKLEMIQGGKNSISMTGDYSAGSTFMFVLAPGEVQGCTVKVVNKVDESWTVTKTSTFILAEGQYKNLGTLDLEISASAVAEHINDGSKLAGTDVKVNLHIPESTLKYVTELNLLVTNKVGTKVREFSKKGSVSKTEIIKADESWPYLPQGEYTLSGSYTLASGVNKTISGVKFTSPAPTFKVTSNAYTSYTKYQTTGASAANAVTGDAICDITSATVAISDDILNNSRYSKGSFTYALDGKATTSANVENQSWGKHVVTATYTFDGVEISGTTDCHVTGLPYRAPSEIAFNASGKSWTKVHGNRTSVNSTSLVLKSAVGDVVTQEPEVKSPDFHIPANIKTNVSIDCNIHSQKFVLWYKTKLTAKVNGTTIISQKSGNSENNNYSLSNSATFTTSGKNIVLETDVYAVDARYADVTKVNVEYQD